MNNNHYSSLDEFNRTEVPFNRDNTVLDLFLNCAKTYPDNTAIIYEDRRYTYHEVDDITTRLACRIVAEGGHKGLVASVLVPRCEYIPIVPLAVLKAGMTYVPLDHTYPAERLEFIIENSDSNLLIATQAEMSLIDCKCNTILLPDANDCMEIMNWDNAGASTLQKTMADDLLTILYTSGTTGNPKGVLIPHMSAIVHSNFMRRKFRITEHDVYGAYCSFGFDVCNMDLFLPLTCGASLCVVPQEIKLDLEKLFHYFCANNVSLTFLPTAIGSRYVSSFPSGTLRCIMIGGEKLLPWGQVYDDCEVYNVYGPTEAFDFNVTYLVRGCEAEIPVGKPNDNTRFYILSESGDRVDIGEEGEICLAGPQVSRGYLKLPELTAKVFTPNPFADGDYGVLYHTGDLGYYRPDGNIIVVGRRDTQVKIRGNRLELKEVEAAVRRFPNIIDATVDAKTLHDGRKVLVAYVVSDKMIPAKDLCRFVGGHKPSYMIPSAVVQMNALPLNQNGKVNRRLLPMPELISDKAYVAPRNEVEEILCDAFSVVLGIGQVGIDDDFMEMGVDSLNIMSIIELCKGIKGLNAGILVSKGTVRKISESLNDDVTDTLDTTPQKDYPVSEGVEGIFQFCTTVPDNTFLHEDLGLRIDRNIDVERLRKAIVCAVNNHPGLKTRFRRNAEGKIRMYRNDSEPVHVTMRNTRECELEDIKNTFVRFYDMRHEPMYRIEIITTEASTYLLMDIHHLVIDGVSFDVLLEDISRSYLNKPLEPEIWTAFDVELYKQKLVGGKLYEEGRQWFERTFGSLTCYCLPEPDVANPSDTMEPAYHSAVLPLSKKKLEGLCVGLNTTLNILAQTAFAHTLAKYTGQKEVFFVCTSDGRDNIKTQRTTGMFSRLEPVFYSFSECQSLSQMLIDANRMRLQCIAHRAFPLSHLSVSRALMNKCIFTNQSGLDRHRAFCGFESEMFNFRNTGTQFGISTELFLMNDLQTLYFRITYKKTLYTPAFIARFANDLVQTLVSFTE